MQVESVQGASLKKAGSGNTYSLPVQKKSYRVAPSAQQSARARLVTSLAEKLNVHSLPNFLEVSKPFVSKLSLERHRVEFDKKTWRDAWARHLHGGDLSSVCAKT